MHSGKALGCLLLLLMLRMESAMGVHGASAKSMEVERQALLAFKQDLIDEHGRLSSWGRSRNCCEWAGVQCSNKASHVIGLNLGAATASSPAVGTMTLKGKISRSLLELKRLAHLDLNYNDFGLNPIPEFIGFLPKLTFLNLSFSNFGGSIPTQLGNASSLRVLDLSFNPIGSTSLDWISHLRLLRYLDLSFADLGGAIDWSHAIDNLPSLIELDLSVSALPPPVAYGSVLPVNLSLSLAVLRLAASNFDSAIYGWILKFNGSLVDVDLSFNQLPGPIPESFGVLCSLKSLQLGSNLIVQKLTDVFIAFSGCTRNVLEILDLSSNQIMGSFPDLTRFHALRKLYLNENDLNETFTNSFHLPSTLTVLDLGANEIRGPLPDLNEFSFLRELYLGENQLTGTINAGLGLLFNLKVLDLSSNYLEGAMSQTHFSNLSLLRCLDLSHNSVALDISSDWVPPFRLDVINLCGCKLGPRFPKWLETQNGYSVLDISRTGISDAVPSKFWDLSPRLRLLNLSHNHLNGLLPKWMGKTNYDVMMDLSSNCFTGSIPLLIPNLTLLDLSWNMFSGPIVFLCDIVGKSLLYMDLSHNFLSGELPNCWEQFQKLLILQLDHNMLSGDVPNSMGWLHEIRSLHLRRNFITGELPSAFSSCTKLVVLDLGENQLSSAIPTWMGDNLSNLAVLSLRSNWFCGIIPSQLCHLQSIRMLDLSENNLSGSIPKCISNFTEMAHKGDGSSTVIEIESPLDSYNRLHPISVYSDTAFLVWKGKEVEYRSVLGLVKSMDFSSNNLTGPIPSEITSLVELVSLNLSRNSLCGSIPLKIGRLEFLESLDLSWNRVSGEIPASLSQINGLSILELNHNNLSGGIPLSTQLQTFSASVYAENPLLCGLPLAAKCKRGEHVGSPSLGGGEEDDAKKQKQKEEDGVGFDLQWIGVGLGFGVGFAAVWGILLLNSAWRDTYFQFLDDIIDQSCMISVMRFSSCLGGIKTQPSDE